MAIVSGVSPSSRDDLLLFIASVVNDRYRSLGLATNGAYLAERIQKRFPGFTYDQFGFSKLGEAVTAAEMRGLVSRKRTVKHLEILPGKVSIEKSFERELGYSQTLHIRADVWRAFVYISKGKTYLYDRQSDKVVISNEANASVEGRIVKIDSIPLDAQQKWMREFVKNKPGLDISNAPIDDDYCCSKFPIWLRSIAPRLDREWKRYHVQHVIEYVREWARTNEINTSSFLPEAEIAATESPPSTHLSLDEEIIRSAIIAAAKELPIDQLKEMAIPIRYIFNALQGR